MTFVHEFKHGLNRYLGEHPGAPVRSLAEVIAFNEANAARVMPYFGQERLEHAQATSGLDAPAYLAARAECHRLARTEGIDKVMQAHDLDAIVAPTETPAWVTDPIMGDRNTGGCSTPAAMAGYPHVTVPAGFVHGLPIGLSFFGRAWSEAALVALGAEFEAASRARRAPNLP